YTRFLDPKKFQELTSQTSGELSGIGIRLEVNELTQALRVVEPIENSPAHKANIKSGDRVLAIDGQSTKGMSLEQASALIRGEVGTSVTLEISREGTNSFDVKLTRTQIELPSVHYTLKQEAGMLVGYISVDEFSSHAAEQMRKAIKNLNEKNVDAYVLDLRNNPGGLLYASIEIARMWIESGTIVSTIDRVGGKQEYSANRTALSELPLAVLVNGNSASASEILTGALQDNQRAIVIGSPTFGKAVVQSVHSLSDGSGLAVTISRYYPPSGVDINHKGITPDIELNLSSEQKRLFNRKPEWRATKEDPQYQRAISALQNGIFWQGNQGQLVKPISIR
ncbi:MAG: PDZ domain-containing protein, partial [Merismopedia sp. SIO2A8]|nr:PDZ domain-containing protein [Merismopedia sp. SIO2A8]